jgi:hypothetical protein
MKKSVSALVATVFTVFLCSSTAMPAIADSMSGAPSDQVTRATEAVWHYSVYYSSGNACNIAKELRRAGGYPVAPSSGCYRDEHGYYFRYQSR